MSSLTRRAFRDPGLTAAGLRTSGVVGAVDLPRFLPRPEPVATMGVRPTSG